MSNDLTKSIIDNPNITNIALINNLYQRLTDFYDGYNFKKIDSYVTYKVPIENGTPDMLLWREKTCQNARNEREVKFDSRQEFKKKFEDRFSVIKCNTSDNIKLFLLYSIFYHLDAIHNSKKMYIGLDFEFNARKIALCQIAFYPFRKQKFIFILDPNDLSDYQTELMIKTVFTSNIYRILHGSDSLDIPYIFEELFVNDKDKILKFTKTVIDTRFICEYHKITTSSENKKCSIYDALLFFNTITKKKYDELNKINDAMGPIQDVNWNVKKMSSYHLKYSAYDVLFLKRFLNDMVQTEGKSTSYINQITRYIFLEKHNLTEITTNSKIIVDKINNYLIKTKDGNKTLINVYNEIVPDIFIIGMDILVKNLLDINYFKSILSILFKRILYSIISERETIYENKNDTYNEKITFKEIYPDLSKMGLNLFMQLIERFYQQAKINLLKII